MRRVTSFERVRHCVILRNCSRDGFLHIRAILAERSRCQTEQHRQFKNVDENESIHDAISTPVVGRRLPQFGYART